MNPHIPPQEPHHAPIARALPPIHISLMRRLSVAASVLPEHTLLYVTQLVESIATEYRDAGVAQETATPYPTTTRRGVPLSQVPPPPTFPLGLMASPQMAPAAQSLD